MDLLKDGPLNPGNILSNFCYSIQNFMEEEDLESIDILAIKMLYKKEVKKLVKVILMLTLKLCSTPQDLLLYQEESCIHQIRKLMQLKREYILLLVLLNFSYSLDELRQGFN